MPATVANFFSKLMFHIFRNEIWTITTNSLAKSTPVSLSFHFRSYSQSANPAMNHPQFCQRWVA